MIGISTSLLNVQKEDIIKTIYNLEVSHTDYFHIDVMDGHFVPKNTSTQMLQYANYIKQISNIPLDVHLMVSDVKKYIDEYIPLEPNIITFHLEAVQKQEIMDIINYIKQNNIKVGISIKPNTKIEELYEYLPYIHMVLIMTVEPGLGGQSLIPQTVKKIEELKEYIEKNNLIKDIQVDGGINLDNIEKIKRAGANIIVAGTTIIKAENYKEIIDKLKQ